MRVVVTSQGTSLDDLVDPRFGRATHFLLVDTDSGEFSGHDNAQNLQAAQGAGIQAAQAVARLEANAVLTGHVGPEAFATLRAGHVVVYTGVTGTVRDALDKFRAGQLRASAGANVEDHWT